MKINKKRIMLLTVFILLIFLLPACNKKKSDVVRNPSETFNASETSDIQVKPTEAAEAMNGNGNNLEKSTDSLNTPAMKDDKSKEMSKIPDMNSKNKDMDKAGLKQNKEIRDITSVELVKEIKIGWNLGNTMDATGGGNTNSAETSWGNPFTTKEIFKTVKVTGFNIVRIPTSWGNHLGPAPDYKINDAWLNRVQDIVDYAIENDIYVILNIHHEEWHFPSYDNLETAKTILTKVWAQIAERFKDYDEHLIFEGMNEPRMKNTNFEWNGGNEEGRDVINQLNATFIETIRNSDGNNPLRHLMIPCYAASSDPKTWKDFIIPEDNNLIVSIHAYTPYNFALNEKGTDTWSITNTNDTREIDSLMSNIYNNFVSKGQPVILGEFGARDKNNLDSREAWAEYYIKKAAEKGIPCIWWDNGAFTGTGELFGLLNRKDLTWEYPEIVDALMKGLK